MTAGQLANIHANTAQMKLGDIRAGWPVQAAPLKAASRTANWLLAHGKPLVCDGAKVLRVTSSESYTFRYRIAPSAEHSSLTILISLSAPLTSAVSTLGDYEFMQLDGYRVRARVELDNVPRSVSSPTMIIQPVYNLGAGDFEFTLDVSHNFVNELKLMIYSIHVFENPMFLLPNTGVQGIEPKEQVYDGYADRESFAGIYRGYEELVSTYFKRGALFSWCDPTSVTRAETIYQSFFPVAPAMQMRLMYSGETTRAVECWVYAKATGGIGDVRFTMTNGSTATVGINSSTGAWFTTSGSLSVEVDDVSRWDVDGGIRGGTRDALTVDYRAPSGGSGTITIYSICVFDGGGA